MPKQARRRKRPLRDYIIPHKRNGHAPYALRHKALFGYSVALVLLKVLVVFASVALPSAFVFSSAITRANIIELTNATRASLGLFPVGENSQLDAAAQAKADDMLAAQYFAHTSPTGKTPWDWIRGSGYTYQVAGENLAVHFFEAEDVTQGWLASPTHRANIVDARYQDIGIGIAKGTYDGYDTMFVVQMFGLPKEVATVSEPAVVEPDVIKEEAVEITPSPEGYVVSVEAPKAESVRVSVGGESEPLSPPKEANGTWTGSIAADAANVGPQGLPLFVETREADGTAVSEAVAWVAPSSSAPELYAFSAAPKPSVRLLGVIDVPNLDNVAGRIYFLTIFLLGAALLVSIVAKFERQRHTVTAHALLVMLLAASLSII